MQILVQQVCGGAWESQILPMRLFPQTQAEKQGLKPFLHDNGNTFHSWNIQWVLLPLLHKEEP